MNEEMCKGCKGACIGEHEYETPLGKTLVCPCTICIVKMICKMGCDAYSDYADEIDQFELQKG